MNYLVAKKTMGMLGCIVFFVVCILAVTGNAESSMVNTVLTALGSLIGVLYITKAVSGNVAKRTDAMNLKRDKS